MTGDLAAFVAARLGEDEVEAAAQRPGTGRDYPDDYGRWDRPTREFDYMRQFNPARMLREVAAKRAILAAYQPNGQGVAYVLEAGLEFALGHLAAVYSDHPDYRQEWAPAPATLSP